MSPVNGEMAFQIVEGGTQGCGGAGKGEPHNLKEDPCSLLRKPGQRGLSREKEPIFINAHQQAPSLLCHLILTTALRGRHHDPIFQKKTKSKFVKQLAYDGKPVRQHWGAQPCALGP